MSSPPARDGARPAARSRWPQDVYAVGDEPDPRFSLANERTALAWVRTALALVACGVGLSTLAEVADLSRWLDGVAALACLVGAGVAVRAFTGWRAGERALRLREPLPAPTAIGWLTAVILVMAVGLAGYAVARLW
jgi:putative membrane protein